ncbi:type I secretion system permease/ATPase [Marinobacterium arenosum]|uniref:type I secretion system permease/ATPase n=1 Tax=Marinobacterium arenosum TaxID=2862496 RepID=UPI001C93DC50|nr:type I secretion system permease/ATPase [Marinobacterium arenosum]MBY4675565.1 type I secretion system permease/ATPase [Marinobacterium arenosum]
MEHQTTLESRQAHQHQDSDNTFFDPLLDALKVVCKLHGRAISRDELRAGLPLVDNRYTQALFIRGAARAGLSARLLQRSFEQLDPLLLPAVLLLRGGRTAVLVRLDDNVAGLIRPETGEGEVEVSLDQLADDYLGFVFYVKKQFRYDERAPQTLKLDDEHWFWGTLKRSWRIYRDVLIASLLISLFAIASPLFVMNVYDRVVPNNAIDTLWVLAAGISLVFLFDFILKQLRAHFIDLAGKKSDILLSTQIFEKVMSIKMQARPASVGAFAKHLQEFDHIREFITSATVTALIDLPFALIFFLVVFLVGGWLAVIPVIIMLIVIGYSVWLQAPLRRSVEETGRMSSIKNATLVEALTGIEMIKVCGAEGQLQRRWEQACGHIADWGIKTRRLTSSAGSVASFCIQMTTVLMIIAGVYRIAEGDLTMGGLIACVMLSSRSLAPMAQIAQLATRYNQAKSALTMLGEIMALPVENPEGKNFIHRESLAGHIRFKQVSFAYPEQKLNALTEVSFDVRPGEKVGIIGRIGSGKSTIGRLATAFYDASAGQVLLDGVDIRQLSPSHVRHLIGVMPQDVTLFYGTLKENLTLGVPWVEDDAVLQAAELAGVTEFSNRHPEGLDMHVAERGANLSGGQRQSVALARALLLNPSVLVMDEPTSSMDNTSEARFRNRLQAHLGDKTLLLITHKASMLELVDRLIVVDQGRIVADGPKPAVQEALRSGRLHLDR